MKLGLVLEGGGLRGAYTAGVLAWFLDNKLEVDYVVGISSGAQHMCNYLIGDKNMLQDVSVKWAGASFEKGLKPLLREGNIVGYDKLFDYVLKEIVPLDLAKLKASKIKGEFAVYNIETSETLWYPVTAIDPDFKLLKAACTLPIASKPVKYEGKKLLDGGITTMIPIQRSLDAGNQKHIVVSTKPKDYVRPQPSFFLNTTLYLFYHKYKQMLKDLKDRTNVYNREIAQVLELEKKGKVFRVNPSRDLGISRFSGDVNKLNDLYELGYQDMEALKISLFEFLK